MTAKEYLSQARVLDMLINSKQAELYKLKLMSTSISSPQISDKVQSNGQNVAMKIIDKIVDLQNEINTEIDNLIDLKIEIRNVIEQIPNLIERVVLIERYINCKSWEEISDIIHYEERNTHYLHGKALQHLAPFCIDLHP